MILSDLAQVLQAPSSRQPCLCRNLFILRGGRGKGLGASRQAGLAPGQQLGDLGEMQELCPHFPSGGAGPALSKSQPDGGHGMCVCRRVTVPGALPLLGVTRHPASLLSQPLFKRFTKTRWAAPAETLEEILTTVGGQLPQFQELQDGCWEVSPWAGAGAWALRHPCLTGRVCTPCDPQHSCAALGSGSNPPWVLGFEASGQW